jgi:hypothetical protein
LAGFHKGGYDGEGMQYKAAQQEYVSGFLQKVLLEKKIHDIASGA